MRYMWSFYEQLEQLAIMPMVMLDDPTRALPVADALAAGGLPCIEVALRTSAALDAIRIMTQERPTMRVGAATVINHRQAQAAVDAGASFVVTPGFDPVVVNWCISQRLPVVPSGVTPTELTALVNRGIDVTQFFPAERYGGLDAIASLSDVFAGHRFLPAGDVRASDLHTYLAHPAVIACAVSWVAPQELIQSSDYASIQARAIEARSTATKVREEAM